MKSIPAFGALFLYAAGAAALPAGPFFEQVAGGAQGAWRTRGASADMLVLHDGFALRKGGQVRRFRWRDSMQLDRLAAEQPLDGASYVLGGAETPGRRLRHAQRVRSAGADGGVSVLYYFGPRGLELDIEIAPGAELPQLRLESLDGDFALTADGAVEIDGQTLALRPIAYNAGSSGERHVVAAEYRLAGRRSLDFTVGSRDAAKRLVIDPVVTYASYFGGRGEQGPVGIRELPDGSIVIAGNTESFDLPLGVVLGVSMIDPNNISETERCFVARLFPAERRIGFVSYLGPATNTSCRAMDVDSLGRVLLLGNSTLPSIATPGAPYPNPLRNPMHYRANFLARLSADGSKLEYATYLPLESATGRYSMLLHAAQGERVYLGFASRDVVFDGSRNLEIPRGFHNEPTSVLILRHDIAAKRFDALTYLPGDIGLDGLELSPAGLVYVYGNGSGGDLPLKDPIQHTPPRPGWSGGFVSAFSADLQRLTFSTYIGGQNFHSNVVGVQVDSAGGVWMVGQAESGAIPGLMPAQPPRFHGGSVFAINFVPGEGAWRKAFHAGGDDSILGAAGALLLDDGRLCVVAGRASSHFTPGGAAVRGSDGRAGLACLDDSATKFQMSTPIGGFQVTQSAAGGIWSLGKRDSLRSIRYDSIPRELQGSAIQPFPAGVGYFNDDLVLRHIDLSIPRPKLLRPQTAYLQALRGNISDWVCFQGTNFALGMQLQFDNRSIPLDARSPFEACTTYAFEGTTGVLVDLRPGRFDGRLVVPAQPEPVASEPFPVIVGRMPPASRPFLATDDPLTIAVAEPVYDDTEVLWRGQRLPVTPGNFYSHPYQVRIPARLAQPGEDEIVIRNPPPGGGVQRWKLHLRGTNSFLLPQHPGPRLWRLPADVFAVDRSAQILYVVVGFFRDEWTLSAHRLPEMERIAEITIPKGEPKPRRAIDLEVSAGGKYLYMLDGFLRVRRFRADSLAMDLEFDIPHDHYERDDLSRSGDWRMKALADEPEAIVVATRAGRLVIYDRDRERPYTTSDFPPQMFQQLRPIVATGEYVYATHRAVDSVTFPNPCLVRYPIDTLGFSHPEEICNPDAVWGAYPEMKRYWSVLALADGEATVHLYGYNSRNIVYPPAGVHVFELGEIDRRSRDFVYRIFFRDLENGVLRGHYPRNGFLAESVSSITFVGESAMVYKVFGLHPTGSVTIVPNWREHVEWY